MTTTRTPNLFVRSLIRLAEREGREALDLVLQSQHNVVKNDNGSLIINVSEAGKSFGYAVPEGFGLRDLTEAVELALIYYDNLSATQRTNLLKRLPSSVATARF